MSINWNRFLFVFINYSINQNYCYILIIPAFGIVSQIVSTFSSKPIFGQCGPKYFIYILKHTICRKVRNIKKQNTILVSHLEIILKLLRTNLMIILLTFSLLHLNELLPLLHLRWNELLPLPGTVPGTGTEALKSKGSKWNLQSEDH